MTDGLVDRRFQEQIGILAGDRGDPLDRAVRMRDLDEQVRRVIQENADAAQKVKPDGYVRDFRAAPLPTGLFKWELGQALWPPPAGRGGGAAFLGRDESGVGTWIAASADGGRGDNVPRIFVSASSALATDFSIWRELYHQRNINGVCEFLDDETPAGSIFEEIENANGLALRFASGLQICVANNRTFTELGGDFLRTIWTFPAAFVASGPLFVSCTAPNATTGTYTDLSQVDVGIPAYGTPSSTGQWLFFRRSHGAPSFVSGANFTNGQAFAFGMWGP